LTYDVAVVSVVPSPYQRDLFGALARRPEVTLKVFYLEASTPDSPWPETPLAGHEMVLPGVCGSLGGVRCHVNWALPDVSRYDVVALNTLFSVTAQRLARRSRRTWIRSPDVRSRSVHCCSP
jgi:hypothetical protein